MKVYVCSYDVFDRGHCSTTVAEVFFSLDRYILWLHEQMRNNSNQYIEGTGVDTRLVTDFREDSYTVYSVRVKEVIE